MKYTIYKGLETPAKIRGFLLADWNKVIGLTIGGGVVIALSLNAYLSSNTSLETFGMITIIVIISYFIIIRHLHSRARKRKYSTEKKIITISNLEISKKIIKEK